MSDYPEEIRRKYPYTAPIPDKEGWYRFQLWELMQKFGGHMYNGCEVPFETGIRIEN